VGWQVTVMASADEQKTIDYFTGAHQLVTPLFDQIDTSKIDEQTAVVLMTHSFNKDVQYLSALQNCTPAYFGLLGPKHRRERLINQFLEFNPEVDSDFIEILRGPAGINIGAESAQEIAISIIAEILSVLRNQEPIVLKDKSGTIHA
jgi:xanthine/CO dehydrogenase XdhC/CoxF family maturation factor